MSVNPNFNKLLADALEREKKEERRKKEMNIDKQIHAVHEYLTGKDIRWHEFHEVGVDSPYYAWYYAENMLYIIRDALTRISFGLSRLVAP